MKIVVLNGSPKGELSVSLQYAAYLAKQHPSVTFTTLHVAQRAKRLESDRAAFEAVVDEVRGADAVLWCFPLYVLAVHANTKRFIELVFERGAQTAFAGKYAAALSTSIHFFDHTAHNYIHAVSDDLGLRFVDSFSADMYDLLNEESRKQLDAFGRHFLEAVRSRVATPRRYPPLAWREFRYQSTQPVNPVSIAGKRVVILHDARGEDENLARMVDRCRAALAGDVTVVNLHDLEIKGSCQGCLLCGANNACIYDGKDEYREFYTQTVMTADVLVYAGRMVDRYLSARWKMVFDRIFFNTHTPVLVGKQVALVISGPISQEPNLLEMLRGFFEFQGAHLVGLVSDEAGGSAEIDGWIDALMARAIQYATTGYRRPQSFLGVGGMKIFRDDVYGRLRPVFPADHRAYTKMGVYKTFPQADLRTTLTNQVLSPLLDLPPVRRRFSAMIRTQMVAPLQRVVAQTEPLPEASRSRASA